MRICIHTIGTAIYRSFQLTQLYLPAELELASLALDAAWILDQPLPQG